MSSSGSRGFTLIEMVMAIVIIGVGVAGVLVAFNTTVQSSADPLIRKQMLAVAEEMMEEIQLKPYAVDTGTISGCNRSAADDVRDYGGYSQAICDIDGAAVAGLGSYTVGVAIAGPAAWQGIADTLQITVTVTHSGDAISLVGWRTDYAGP